MQDSKTNKIEIKEYVYEFTGWELEGDMLEISKRFSNTKLWYKEKFPQSGLNIDKFHRFALSHNYMSDESDQFVIEGYRWETDEECNKRIEKANKAKENAKKAAITAKKNKEANEKAEYERLKNKYGK